MKVFNSNKPGMIPDAFAYIKKYPILGIGLFLWFAGLFFVIGTTYTDILEKKLNKKVLYKVGYCVTYMGGGKDTFRYEFKGKTNVPFESYLKFNSNGCVSNYDNIIIACGVRKVEWLYTQTFYPVKNQ